MEVSVEYIHRFLTSFAFTEIVEISVLFIFVRFALKNYFLSRVKIFFAGFLASFATIPYVWFVFPSIANWTRESSLVVSEPFVFAVEALLYRAVLGLEVKHAFLVSLLANLSSFVLGPLLRSYGLWIYW